jgi:hypothetical protein
VVEIWLEFLSRNPPGYRDFVLNRENLSQLPEDDSVFDRLSIHEVSLDSIETDANLLVELFAELEDDQECDEAAVPNLLIHRILLANQQEGCGTSQGAWRAGARAGVQIPLSSPASRDG